jgi:CBS domain containing-hemolysin-like protein
MLTVLGIVLILLGLLALALQRFYSCVPAKELKRLAARGDHLASALYRPVAYGTSMRLLLWLVTALSLSGGLLIGIYQLPSFAAFLLIAVLFAAMVILQTVRLTVRSAKLAVRVSPALNWLLTYLHPAFDMAARTVNRFRVHTPHSGLYEKEDLLALLQQQKAQVDNRISHRDLDLLERAAQFDDRQAADFLVPMSRAKLVNADEPIGPILLGELHDSGQSSFLVYEGTKDHVVGTLFLRDAMQAKEGGLIRDLLHPRLCFVHEDFTLRQVLHALAHTSQFMVVVINAFEEPVGVITLQQLLKELIGGDHPEEDFDRYEDRSAVAAFQPVLQPAEVPVVDDEGEVDPEPELPPSSEESSSEEPSQEQPSPEETEVVK